MATNTHTSRGIARTVAAALNSADILPQDAAAAIGRHPNTLARRLNGDTPFKVSELEALAGLTGRNVSDFIAPQDAA